MYFVYLDIQTIHVFFMRLDRLPVLSHSQHRPSWPPTILIHGREDTDAPDELPAAMAKEPTRHKVTYELVTVKGAGHGPSGGEKWFVDDADGKAPAFLRTRMKSDSLEECLPGRRRPDGVHPAQPPVQLRDGLVEVLGPHDQGGATRIRLPRAITWRPSSQARRRTCSGSGESAFAGTSGACDVRSRTSSRQASKPLPRTSPTRG